MKIKDFLRRETPGTQLIKSWLFTLNLFFIMYALVELFTFLLSPDSGRLSTLVCRPDAQGRSLCTITITGMRQIFRASFWADDYVDTARSDNYRLTENQFLSYMNLALPWDGVFESDSTTLHDSPASLLCAVSIQTVDKYIDFVPPYQHETQCDQAEAQIKAAFAGDRSAINIRLDGYSPNITRRAVVLAIAAMLFLVQSASRLIRRRQDRKAVAEAEEQKYQLQPERVGSMLIPGEPAAEDVAQPHGRSTRKFVLTWWAASVLPIVFWVVLSYLVAGLVLPENCFLSVSDYRSLISITPLSNLLSIAPLVILSTLLAVLQWQVLRMQLRISGWWITAPLIAGIPLLFWLPTGLKCQIVNSLATPFFMSEPSWNIVGYFFLVGCIQWLVLRRKLSYSIGWILIPVLCAFVEVGMLIILGPLVIFQLPIWGLKRFLVPIVIGISPILLMLDTIISPVAGYYLYRLILARRKKLLPASNGGDEVLAG